MSNITHYGYTPDQIKGMAAEIERLTVALTQITELHAIATLGIAKAIARRALEQKP